MVPAKLDVCQDPDLAIYLVPVGPDATFQRGPGTKALGSDGGDAFNDRRPSGCMLAVHWHRAPGAR